MNQKPESRRHPDIHFVISFKGLSRDSKIICLPLITCLLNGHEIYTSQILPGIIVRGKQLECAETTFLFT